MRHLDYATWKFSLVDCLLLDRKISTSSFFPVTLEANSSLQKSLISEISRVGKLNLHKTVMIRTLMRAILL